MPEVNWLAVLAATAATFSAVAYPEMRRFGYPQSFSTGVIAAGGTLGAMLPPSTVLAVYGIITEQDIGKLFIAGILPGLLAVIMYMITVGLIGVVRPNFLPSGPRHSWKERLGATKDVWATLLDDAKARVEIAEELAPVSGVDAAGKLGVNPKPFEGRS